MLSLGNLWLLYKQSVVSLSGGRGRGGSDHAPAPIFDHHLPDMCQLSVFVTVSVEITKIGTDFGLILNRL